jgi:hypothetical protein
MARLDVGWNISRWLLFHRKHEALDVGCPCKEEMELSVRKLLYTLRGVVKEGYIEPGFLSLFNLREYHIISLEQFWP